MTERCRCGKKVFPSFARAVGAALGTSKLFGKPMRPYRCPKRKGAWHLTTSSGQEFEARQPATEEAP